MNSVKTLSSLGKSNSKSTHKMNVQSRSSPYTFTPTQILIGQILKVIKLRLAIENIKIPDEKLIEIIKENLTYIDIRTFKISSLNVLVEDLLEVIKKGDFTNKSQRTTILSFNRKEYNTSDISKISGKKTSPSITKEPMKFNLENKGKKEDTFYLNNKGDISLVTDYDLEEIQDKIIDEVSKEFFVDKGFN